MQNFADFLVAKDVVIQAVVENGINVVRVWPNVASNVQVGRVISVRGITEL